MRNYGEFSLVNDKLYVVYPSFEPSLDEYKAYLLKQETFLKEAKSLFIIYDTSLSKYMSAENRAIQSKWINDNKDLLKNKVKKMVFVIPSIAVRLVLKTILAFSPLPCPHLVVDSMKEAEKQIQ